MVSTPACDAGDRGSIPRRAVVSNFCYEILFLILFFFFYSPMSQNIRTMLRRACVEKRLTVGILPAIQYLTNNSNGALFCLTTEAPPGDSATHMQEVLLQAFCVENDIYTIKVNIWFNLT